VIEEKVEQEDSVFIALLIGRVKNICEHNPWQLLRVLTYLTMGCPNLVRARAKGEN
jgi:hypothetical protein